MAGSSDAVAIMRQRIDARKDEGDTLASSITEAGVSLKFSTLALRSCYSVNASSIREFVDFRSELTTTAMVYKNKVLPLAKASLQQVKDFMLYFQDLSFEECVEIASEILADARVNKDLMILNRDTHKAMAVEFKQMEDKVDKVLKKCALEETDYKQKAEALMATAERKNRWAVGLAFIPLVGAVASPWLFVSANSDISHAVAASQEAKLAVAASHVVKDTLAVALNEYCFAMDRCAGEFEKLASECTSFAKQGERLEDTKKKAFFLMMNKRAAIILDAVSNFQMVVVSAETDLECLPAADSPNYVQQWLATKTAGSGQPSFLSRVRALAPAAAIELTD